MSKIGSVILSAGMGKRMNSTIPKVMTLLHGKPLVAYVYDAIQESLCCEKPVIVVNPNHTFVQDYFKDAADYAVQEEQLGTAHAVLSAKLLLKDRVDHVVVLYGDMPFVKPTSIARLVKEHTDLKNAVTLMTATVPNFEDWCTPFLGFGRIVRDKDRKIVRIVEKKDATSEELEIREVNPSYFCFNADWLWKNLEKIQNNNAQKEYYLVDLVKLAIDQKDPLSSIDIQPEEVLGVNTQEDLEIVKKIGKKDESN